MQKLIYFIKADAHEETLLHKQNWVQDAKKCFWKVFCFQDADLCLNICCVGSQTRKHLRNTKEALTFNVSGLFSLLLAKTIYSEDTESASPKQNVLLPSRLLIHATL